MDEAHDDHGGDEIADAARAAEQAVQPALTRDAEHGDDMAVMHNQSLS
jgi:hypothetical protein